MKAQQTESYVRFQVERRRWGKKKERVWLYVVTFMLDRYLLESFGLQQGDTVGFDWETCTIRKGQCHSGKTNAITWRSHGCGKVQVLRKDKPSRYHNDPGDLARYFTLKVSPEGEFSPGEEMDAPPSPRWEKRRLKCNQLGQQIRKVRGKAAEALEMREIRRKGSARAKYYKPAGGYRG